MHGSRKYVCEEHDDIVYKEYQSWKRHIISTRMSVACKIMQFKWLFANYLTLFSIIHSYSQCHIFIYVRMHIECLESVLLLIHLPTLQKLCEMIHLIFLTFDMCVLYFLPFFFSTFLLIFNLSFANEMMCLLCLNDLIIF